MRRAAAVLLSAIMVLGLFAGAASAVGITVRTDPDDTAGEPDIRKVWSDVSARRLLVRIGTWERLRTRASFSVLLDTRGSPELDRIIEISGQTCVVEKLRDGFLGDFIGQRDWRRLDRRSIACALPPGWFGIRKTVRFAVLTGTAGGPHPDRAPNDGRFMGL